MPYPNQKKEITPSKWRVCGREIDLYKNGVPFKRDAYALMHRAF
jgi:hypothetical protein